MKKILITLSVLAIINLVRADTMSSIAGSYMVSIPDISDIPVSIIITITADGSVSFTEKSPHRKLECTGKASLKSDLLTSQVKCETGQEFTQRVNLKGVKSFEKFAATVYSSLNGLEIEMNFEKIKD